MENPGKELLMFAVEIKNPHMDIYGDIKINLKFN